MGSVTHANSTSDNNENYSNLTNIRGIGVSRKRWLNSLGIYTIADLSQASADEIESQIKNNERLLSRSELEEWIAQAQAFAPAYEQAESLSNLAGALPEAELAATSTDWNTIAVFKIEYQTRQVAGQLEQRTIIHHLETDAIESWSDFETQSIQLWMLDRLDATVAQPNVEGSIVPEITQLRVIQSHETEQTMIVDKTHPLFPSAIQTDDPFALEVSMRFVGSTDANLQKQTACRVQCIAHDVSKGSTITLGEITTNFPPANHVIYRALLPELMLSHAGIYRLKVFVALQDALAENGSMPLGYFKVPMLQVV